MKHCRFYQYWFFVFTILEYYSQITGTRYMIMFFVMKLVQMTGLKVNIQWLRDQVLLKFYFNHSRMLVNQSLHENITFIFKPVLRIQIHWIWIRIQDFGPIWIRIQGNTVLSILKEKNFKIISISPCCHIKNVLLVESLNC